MPEKRSKTWLRIAPRAGDYDVDGIARWYPYEKILLVVSVFSNTRVERDPRQWSLIPCESHGFSSHALPLLLIKIHLPAEWNVKGSEDNLAKRECMTRGGCCRTRC